MVVKNLKWQDYQNALQVKSHNYPPLILNNLISQVRRDDMRDVYRISLRFLINNLPFRNYFCLTRSTDPLVYLKFYGDITFFPP
jgi:hypothetical protein